MYHHEHKPEDTRAQREDLFRQAERAFARSLTWLTQSAAGRHALAMVLSLRCTDEPGSGVWFHATPAVLETAQASLEARVGQSLRFDRAYAGRLRITCDGIAAVISRLDAEVEPMVMQRIEAERARGHAYLHRVVLDNLSLVSYWMHKDVRTNDQDREDIAQAARQGLIRAAQRFDVERGVQFSTCAFQWFRSFAHALRDTTRCQVGVPKADIRNLRRLHAVLDAHGRFELGSRDVRWLAKELGLAEQEVRQLLIIDQQQQPLDTTDFTPTQGISAEDDTESNVIALEHTRLCESALATLDDRTQKVVRMRFGIGCERPYEANEIARQLDVSVERVRQIYMGALRALRENQQLQDIALVSSACA